eukprot:m.20768 g.20768  ORF g.20768 m.20768 type:complete len:272 (-) comp12240_c0_seq3:234-1049(-)
MEEIRVLCVGGGDRATVMATFKDNEFHSKGSSAQHEPIHLTTVVRGQPKKLIVEDFDSNKGADNYQNVDMVLIFFDCATESEDFAAATRYSHVPSDRPLSWVKEVKLLLPSTPFIFVLTGAEKRTAVDPDGIAGPDGKNISTSEVKAATLANGAVGFFELRTSDMQSADVVKINTLFQTAVCRALEPGQLYTRGCAYWLCCGGCACLSCCPGKKTFEFLPPDRISQNRLVCLKMQSQRADSQLWGCCWCCMGAPDTKDSTRMGAFEDASYQ